MSPSEVLPTQVFLFSTGLLISAAVAGILTMVVRYMALQLHLLDQPNHRSAHKTPTPRLGGIAIVGGFFAGYLYFWCLEAFVPGFEFFIKLPQPLIMCGAVLMAMTGLIDDLKGMSPKVKLYLQCAAAAIVVLGGLRFNLPFIPADDQGLFFEVLSMGITFLWIVGMINAVNLLDGLDGLAAGVAVIAISSLAIALAVNGYGAQLVFVAVFIGALIGFLLHNSHPASIFMGDTGSLFLGFMLATFALPVTEHANLQMSYLIPVLALGLPILDTFTAIVRRALERKGIFTADKEHIHHRMGSRLGLNHHQTVIALYGISLIFGVTAIWVAASNQAPMIALALSVCGSFILALLIKLGYIKPTLNAEDGLVRRRAAQPQPSAPQDSQQS